MAQGYCPEVLPWGSRASRADGPAWVGLLTVCMRSWVETDARTLLRESALLGWVTVSTAS